MNRKEINTIEDACKKLNLIHTQLHALLQEKNPLAAETDVVDIKVSTSEPEGPTIDDVRAKVGEAIMALSPEVVQGVFVNYKVAKVSQFRPEQYGNLIETLDEMIKEASNETDA